MKPTIRLFVVGASIAGCAVFRPSTAAGPGGAHTPLARSIDSMIGARDFRSANWGILIVDPERRETLYTHNATKLFIPASNQKLVVSSVLLERMGPDYHFRTILAARGTIADGTLNGDLAVIGRGDPTASNHMKGDAMLPLRAIADSLWQRGVRRITGDVVAAGDAMPGAVAGAAWPWDALDGNSYAGVDELLFNEGLSAIRVRPGAKIGDPAVVQTAIACAAPSAFATPRRISSVRLTESRPCSLMTCFSVRPGTCAMTSAVPEVPRSRTRWTATMFGWSSCATKRASRAKRVIASSSSMYFARISLMATSSLVARSRAR